MERRTEFQDSYTVFRFDRVYRVEARHQPFGVDVVHGAQLTVNQFVLVFATNHLQHFSERQADGPDRASILFDGAPLKLKLERGTLEIS